MSRELVGDVVPDSRRRRQFYCLVEGLQRFVRLIHVQVCPAEVRLETGVLRRDLYRSFQFGNGVCVVLPFQVKGTEVAV